MHNYMKKIIFCLLALSFFVGGVFAEEKAVANNADIHFKMPEMKLNLDNEDNNNSARRPLLRSQKVGIALTAVGASLLTIAISSTTLTVLLIADVFHTSFVLLGYVFCSSMSYLALFYGAMLLAIGVYVINTPDVYIHWKYYVTKIIRNIGIAMAAASAIPFAGCVYTCYYYSNNIVGSIYNLSIFEPFVAITLATAMAFGMLIGGIVLTAVGSGILYKRYGRFAFAPLIDITHNEKKNFDEGYAVRVGMSVRI